MKKPVSKPRPWGLKQDNTKFELQRRNNSFYHTRAWRTLRDRVLHDEPLCRSCHQAGRIGAATVVDHILPINAGGAKLDRANLQPMSAVCHNTKTAKEKQQ